MATKTPAPAAPSDSIEEESAAAPAVEGEAVEETLESHDDEGTGRRPEAIRPDPTNNKERFFVVKSLTLEDLELSVKNGIWATQAHNEAVLNKAYGVSAFRSKMGRAVADMSIDFRGRLSNLLRQ